MTDESTAQKCRAFIARLKEMRIQRGLSTYDVAEKAGMKQQHVSRMEQGEQLPNLISIFRYAEAIGAKISIK